MSVSPCRAHVPLSFLVLYPDGRASPPVPSQYERSKGARDVKVLNFGSLNIDYVYKMDSFVQPGETKTVLERQVNCGGKGLNQSVALASAGLDTWHAGLVGPDGQFLVDKLAARGVHTDFIRTVPESVGHAIIEVDASGQNRIIVYPGTNRMLTVAYVNEVLSHFAPGDVVLLQNETNLVGEIVTLAADRGLLVALNAAPMDDGVKSFPLEKVRWLFVNEIEAAALSGERHYASAARVLRERCPNTEVIMTLGAEGSMYLGNEGNVTSTACRVSPVDTTGAGDTFTGFFLRGVLGPSLPLSPLELASVASGIAVTRPGAADSIPTLEEVLSSSLHTVLP